MPTVRLSIALIFAALSQAQTSLTIGMNVPAAASANCTMNAAANYCAFAWTVGNANKTLNVVRIMMNSVTGTVPIGDLQLDIYTNAAGQPDTSSLASANSTVAGAAATWQEWNGLSLSLTANTQYWFVIRNNNATPASNFVVLRYAQGLNVAWAGGSRLTAAVATSTNSGSTWTNVGNSMPFMRLGYSDSTFAGTGIESYVTAVNANYRVYGTRAWGFRFTSPANASPTVSGCAFNTLTKVASASGVRCKIYQVNSGAGTATVVATSVDLAAAQYSTSGASNSIIPFSTMYSLQPSTDYIVALETTNTADTSSNYTIGSTITAENTSGSLGLLPFSGSMRGVYCTGTCTTWSNWTVVTDIPTGSIQLDFTAPFASTSGGSAGCSYAFIK